MRGCERTRALELPDGKDLFRLNEACRVTGVRPATLRRWGRQFVGIEPTSGDHGQLLLTRHQVRLLMRIRQLVVDQRLPVADARRRIDEPSAEEDRAAMGSADRSRPVVSTVGGGESTARPGASPRPWEDTEIRILVQERLGPLLSELADPPPAPTRGEKGRSSGSKRARG